MYAITDETETEYVVTGPNDFKRQISKDDYGVVLRASLECEESAQRYVVQGRDMTHAELIAHALGIDAYPA